MKAADFGKLTQAEECLIEHLRSGIGGFCVIGENLPSENASIDLCIRGRLIRALVMGKLDDVPTPESDICVQGAYIKSCDEAGREADGLDLEGVELDVGLLLVCCYFLGPVLLRRARVPTLNFGGSEFARSLNADGLRCDGYLSFRQTVLHQGLSFIGATLGDSLDFDRSSLEDDGRSLDLSRVKISGSLFLREAYLSGTLRLTGSRIEGNLDCSRAGFVSTNRSLDAERLDVAGHVLLRDIEAAGEVYLPMSRIGGQLSLARAQLSSESCSLGAANIRVTDVMLGAFVARGTVRLISARIGGDLDCEGGKFLGVPKSLNCQSAKVDGVWLWRKGASSRGLIDLTSARFGAIADDPQCWPDEFLLDRCHYGGFSYRGVDSMHRIDWLARMVPHRVGVDFWPQPYEECARALRDAGHGADARAVLIEKERLQRAARHDRLGKEISAARSQYLKLDLWLQRWLLRASDWLLGKLVAYGRRPLQAAIPLIALTFIGAMIFLWAADAGQIKPNQPRVLTSQDWTGCQDAPEGQLACFRHVAPSYPKFAPLIYSADTLLPIVSLEMQSYWIPDDRKPIGAFARFYLWVHIFAGWGLTLLAVAGFSGLIKTDNTK